jgi:DNA-binding beta-propeller fold protein YncE
VTTVVGLVINETLDDTTLNDQTIQIIPAGGQPVACDVVSSQHNVVNVVPKAPLLPATVYEVKLVEGGVKDVAGNGMRETSFTFTTEDPASPDLPPQVTGVLMTPASPIEAGAPVQFTAAASDPEGGTLEYRWDFGDGTRTAWGPASAAAHAYSSAGNYLVLAQARDAGGAVGARSLTLTAYAVATDVSAPAQDRRARGRSSQIAVDGGRRWAWVSNPDADSVTELNLDSLGVVREVAVGKRPMGITFDVLGRGWVACRDSDEVRVLDWSGAAVRTLKLARGSRPVSVSMEPNGTTAYVAEYGTGKIRRFDVNTFAETGSLSVGPAPKALAVTDDGGRLLVSRFISGDAGGEVRVVDLASFALEAPVALPLDSFTADTAATGRGVPNYVDGLSVEPGTGRVWYAAKKDNVLKGLFRDGTPLGHDSTVRALAGVFDPAAKAEDVSSRVDIDNNIQPSAVLADPHGAVVFVALMGNNRVVALDARTGQELTRADVGLAPQGLGLDPVTNRLWVEDFMGRTVTVLDADALIRNGTKTLPKVATISTVGTEKLVPQVLQGKKVFYNAEDPRMSLEGYVSCAVCHLDGGHDGRTWDFTDRGEGLRNTITLKGRRGTGQGRVHWTGNFDEIQDFEHDIRGPFGGTGFMGDASFHQGTRDTPLGDPKAGISPELDALAAYVMSLSEVGPSPHKNQDGTLTAEGARGKAVFQRMSCAQCHAGADFTDSAKNLLHDVGTIKASSGKRLNGPLPGFDTPTLKGLWDTAPYLHDGSAATLVDVMNAPDAGKHGHMDQLSSGEKSDLAAYLLQIDDAESAPEGGVGPAGMNADPEAATRILSPGGDGNNDTADFGANAAELEVLSGRGRRICRRSGREWDGKDGAGKPVPSGLYVVKVTGKDGVVTYRKVLIVK